MSLIRQVWLLVLGVLALAYAGGFGVSLFSARHYLETQLRFKDQDTAQSLALTLGQQHGDAAAMELAIASQFDTGHYELIRLVAPDERVVAERAAGAERETSAPGWFVALLGIRAGTAVAQVSDGWRPIGRLEMRSRTGLAHDELWHSTRVSAGLFVVLALATGAIGYLGVARIRRPLAQTAAQALALSERRFVEVDEPAVPELRMVARAMNTMVARLRALFQEQAEQVDNLRRQARCDPLTGLAHRQHFLSRLKVALESEEGHAGGALLLVRLVELQTLNRRVGRAAADGLIQSAATELLAVAARGGEVGRLNGSDFALLLFDVAVLREPANDAMERLRSLLAGHEGVSYAVMSAVRWTHAEPMSEVLATADQALARAEARGAWAFEAVDGTSGGLVLGEGGWRQGIEAALRTGQAELASFPLIDAERRLVHLECPLRLRIGPGRAALPAAQWLPMAQRAGLTVRVDLVAIELALSAIARDGVPRGVNVSPASLTDGRFVPQLRTLLYTHPKAAAQLALEVAEAGAIRNVALMRELATQLHAHGARLGVKHAGEEIARDTDGLLASGLDFAKLDASLSHQLAADAGRIAHVIGLARMLHGIGFKVYAEGVAEAADAEALWRCGVDGLSGPAAAP